MTTGDHWQLQSLEDVRCAGCEIQQNWKLIPIPYYQTCHSSARPQDASMTFLQLVVQKFATCKRRNYLHFRISGLFVRGSWDRATFRRSFSRKTSERPSQDKILHTGEHRELWLSPCENGPIPGQTARPFVKTRFDGKKTYVLKPYLFKKKCWFSISQICLKMLHYHQES